jgi:hypothetical protein
MDKTHQRVGAKSNAHVGRDFELATQIFLASKGLDLDLNVKIEVGVEAITKGHAFDLGCESLKVIVECKSHKWTAPNDNVPSAKLTVWNEAMYYFLLAPAEYRKIMFVLSDYSEKRKETLAEYYLRTYRHLIPNDVELWEFDEIKKIGRQLL